MSDRTEVALHDLFAERLGSVDPSKFPDEVFTLYSVPSFDVGAPEVVRGSDIGSTKQLVQAGDVLLSKIVPHLRRAWVVSPHRNTRIIASGEWLVFRSSRFDARYLRHSLISDAFHVDFMQTVSGVGGSLLRARPSHVAKIRIPLPPLAEQRRISAILDQADALRAKRREAIAKLNTLVQAIFLDMFGDPIENPNGFEVRPLISLVDPAHGILMPGPEQENGIKYVRVVDMKDGGIRLSTVRRTTPAIAHEFRRSTLKPGDLLMSIRGHVGRFAVVPPELDGGNITQDTARLALAGVNSDFVRECLRTESFQRWMARHTKGVAVRGINLGDVKLMPIILPDAQLQKAFSMRAKAVRTLLENARSAAKVTDELFSSLQYRAFAGTL